MFNFTALQILFVLRGEVQYDHTEDSNHGQVGI